MVVVGARRSAVELPSREPPELRDRRRLRIERGAIEACGALGALGDPAGVEERLEMSADGRLRHLEGPRQLADAKLVMRDEPKKPHARRIAEQPEPAKPVGVAGCEGVSIAGDPRAIASCRWRRSSLRA
ncbi:MAG: hypothetical protein U0575_11360 [Phycisphaerales bacterium]